MKTMVCVDLNEESLKLLKTKLKSKNWTDVTEVHFVHGFQLQMYADNFYFSTYPLENEYEKIESSVNDLMVSMEKEIFTEDKKPKVYNKCIISHSPKKSLAEYTKENSIDEMVIATREKSTIGELFSSSFAEYMIRHVSCELRILRLNN